MLMQIDGTFIFVAISFIIFLLIIKAILFNPITKVIDERNSFYAKNAKMETESKEKSRALLDEKERALKSSRIEASNIVKKTTQEADLWTSKPPMSHWYSCGADPWLGTWILSGSCSSWHDGGRECGICKSCDFYRVSPVCLDYGYHFLPASGTSCRKSVSH